MEDSFDDIVAWQGLYVAVGEIIGGTSSQAAAWTSTDGRTWEQTMATGGPTEEARANRVLVTAHGLVAIGWVGVLHCPQGGEGATQCDPLPIVFWTSADGRTWTRHDGGAMFDGASIGDVATDSEGLVAVGENRDLTAAIWRSSDVSNWTAADLGAEFTDAHFNDIAWTGSAWIIGGHVGVRAGGVLVASMAAIWRSKDGDSWAPAALDGGTSVSTVESVLVGSDGLAALGKQPDSGSTTWSSIDGSAWAITDHGPSNAPRFPSVADGSIILAESYAAGDWVAYWISTNGNSWQALEDGGQIEQRPHWQARPQADSAFLVGGQLFVLSSDGFIWSVTISQP